MTSRILMVVALSVAGAASVAGAQSTGELVARIDSLVEAEMKKNGNVGLSIGVERGGELLLARGYGSANLESGIPATAETIYRIGSVTKQFTAAIILRLVEQGKVALSDPITKFLPTYPTQGRQVTIQHLLTHTSGIKSYTSLGPKFWNELSRLDATDSMMIAAFATQPFDFEPGAKYAYNNSAYFLLGTIIGKVTGMPYPEYLEKQVLQPLGLVRSSFCDEQRILPGRAQGYEVVAGKVVNDGLIGMNTPGAAGAMCSTVLDLLSWQRALDGGRVITEASAKRMRTGQIKSGPQSEYGYGIGIGAVAGHRLFSHSGGINGFNSWLGNFPDDRVTVVVLTNNAGGRAVELGQAISRIALGLPVEMAPRR